MDRLPGPRGLRLRRRHAAARRRPHARPSAGRRSARSARCGTATRCGCWSPAARRSPRSRSGTRRCSAASTSRCSLILVALIVRVMALEYRNKHDDPVWQRRWDVAIVASSATPALLWGVAFANIVGGSPLAEDGSYAGNFLDLLRPYTILGGRDDAAAVRAARRALPRAAHRGPGARARQRDGRRLWLPDRRRRRGLRGLDARRRRGRAPARGRGDGAWRRSRSSRSSRCTAPGARARRSRLTTVAIAGAVVMLFATLYPNVMVSSGPGPDLTIAAAASTHYTLKVMTVVAVVMTPIVLLYQGWTYWVFRARDLGGRSRRREDAARPAGPPRAGRVVRRPRAVGLGGDPRPAAPRCRGRRAVRRSSRRRSPRRRSSSPPPWPPGSTGAAGPRPRPRRGRSCSRSRFAPPLTWIARGPRAARRERGDGGPARPPRRRDAGGRRRGSRRPPRGRARGARHAGRRGGRALGRARAAADRAGGCSSPSSRWP